MKKMKLVVVGEEEEKKESNGFVRDVDYKS